MELRQLHYVIKIAEEKSFSRAAEKLHIAQPSLSQQCAKLEKEIGVLLFQRSTNAVELTHAGRLFVEKAQKVVDMIIQMEKEMQDISMMKKGKLTIGSLPITGSHILPRVLPVFKEKYPDVEIALVEDTTTNLELLTARGQTDLSLLSLPFEDKSLAYQPLVEEEICLAVPPSHPKLTASGTSSNRRMALQQFQHEPFIILKRGQGFRQITLDFCEQAGFRPQIVFESSNIETVQSLVASGMGIALVPEMVARAKWSHFAPAYIRLAEKPTRTLVIAYRKGRYLSKAAEAFIETMLASME